LTSSSFSPGSVSPRSSARSPRQSECRRPGTHRILATLAARGFVVRADGGVYSLGYRAWEIGWSVPGVQMVPRAVPVMQRMADAVGDGAILGALDSGFESSICT
jgi:DNA-binding IclR family transcriptional regulator